jgi:hypothetical protein
VPLVEDDLWCHVLWRAADSPRAILDTLGEAEVDHLEAVRVGVRVGVGVRVRVRVRVIGSELGLGNHLEVAIGVDEQILRLEVPVDDLLVVQVLEGHDEHGRVEAAPPLREALLEAQHTEELAAERQLEEEVERPRVLEGAHLKRREGA